MMRTFGASLVGADTEMQPLCSNVADLSFEEKINAADTETSASFLLVETDAINVRRNFLSFMLGNKERTFKRSYYYSVTSHEKDAATMRLAILVKLGLVAIVVRNSQFRGPPGSYVCNRRRAEILSGPFLAISVCEWSKFCYFFTRMDIPCVRR